MLYFKTKKNSLIVKICVDHDKDEYVFVTITCLPNGYYPFKVSYAGASERVWNFLVKKNTPNNLSDNPKDYQMYETAMDDQDKIDQEIADSTWEMSMVVHYR